MDEDCKDLAEFGKNIPLRRKKSNISLDSLFLQQLAVIIEELSRKVILGTQQELFRFFQGIRMFFTDVFLQSTPQIVDNVEIRGLCRPIFSEVNPFSHFLLFINVGAGALSCWKGSCM